MAEQTLDRFVGIRRLTDALAAPIPVEEQALQSMPDASPTKWHLAHTSWFFERFVLRAGDPDYRPFSTADDYLWNSYYDAVGARHPRPFRGLLGRPSAAEVRAYRAHVDEAMARLIARGVPPSLAPVVEVGLQHEQQHQELLLTDALHLLAQNPLAPAYRTAPPAATGPMPSLGWRVLGEGLVEVGHAGGGFAFDNESPRHRVFLGAYAMADRLVTNAEYLEFVHDGGYRRPDLWLSDGWLTAQSGNWSAPLYWQERDGAWHAFGLGGPAPLDPRAPVSSVSFYEADAYARWAGARLPTEHEWEHAAAGAPVDGNLLDTGALAPRAAAATATDGLRQRFGDVWEWTASPYVAYPRYRAWTGALGEYNGKFMCNQMVLRGGSCLTPKSHVRATYRNFFHPDKRWQMSGIRLARDA